MKRPLVFLSLMLCLLQGCMSHQATLLSEQDPAAVEKVVAQQGSGSPDAPPLKLEKYSDNVPKNIVKIMTIGGVVLAVAGAAALVLVLALAKTPATTAPPGSANS